MKNRRFFQVLIWVLILVNMLVAYAPSSAADLIKADSIHEARTASAQSSPTPTPDIPEDNPTGSYGATHFPETINPLTGLPVSDTSLLERRPLAIKISNGPRGIRPQWGLSLADQVFEYFHETGRTRFNAIFYGNNAKIAGPIRSARFADEAIVRMYKAFFAFGSADLRVLNQLWTAEFADRLIYISDTPCPPSAEHPLCRIDPNGYNHLVTDTELLSEHFTQAGIPQQRQNLDGLLFSTAIPENGESGESATTRYSRSFYNRWEYDPVSGRYLRYQDKYDAPTGSSDEEFEVLSDRLTDQPIMADNVIILLAEHAYFSREPEMWEIGLLGSGKAYLFRDEQAYELDWVRAAESDLISLTYLDGSAFPLKPGNTWYQVIGMSSTINKEDGRWRFVHMTP